MALLIPVSGREGEGVRNTCGTSHTCQGGGGRGFVLLARPTQGLSSPWESLASRKGLRERLKRKLCYSYRYVMDMVDYAGIILRMQCTHKFYFWFGLCWNNGPFFFLRVLSAEQLLMSSLLSSSFQSQQQEMQPIPALTTVTQTSLATNVTLSSLTSPPPPPPSPNLSSLLMSTPLPPVVGGVPRLVLMTGPKLFSTRFTTSHPHLTYLHTHTRSQ